MYFILYYIELNKKSMIETQ